MKNKKSQTLIVIFLISISIISIFFIFKNQSTTKIVNTPNSPPPNLPRSSGEEQVRGLTLEINDIKYQSDISGPISVSLFMDKLKDEGKINFKEKTYTGMGKFIEEINGTKNSGEKNWIYYVNGQKANIGISNYKINNGDIVSWRYEKGY